MPRYAVPITGQELKAKLTELAHKVVYTTQPEIHLFKKQMEDIYDGQDIFDSVFHLLAPNLDSVDKIKSDLKIKFDTENTVNLRFRTRKDGVTFFEFEAGGDWEHPVFVSMYFDGRNIRAYIPSDGNIFNPSTRSAFGGDKRKYFREFVEKREPEKYREILEKYDDSNDLEDAFVNIVFEMDFDYEKLHADIDSRVLCKDPSITRPYQSEFDEWLSIYSGTENKNFMGI